MRHQLVSWRQIRSGSVPPLRTSGGWLRRTGLIFLISVCQSCPSAIPQQQETAPFTDKQVVSLLNRTVTWYQNGVSRGRSLATPGEISYLDNTRSLSDQIVRLMFDFGHAAAGMLAAQPAAGHTDLTSRYSSVFEQDRKLTLRQQKDQADLNELQERIATAPRGQRKAIEASIAERRSELSLLNTKKNALDTFLQFAGGSSGPDSLQAQIDSLERATALPALVGDKPSQSGSVVVTDRSIAAASPVQSGILSSIREISELSKKIQAVSRGIRETDQLSLALDQAELPLRSRLDETSRRGEALVNEDVTQNPDKTAEQSATLDQLNAQFKTLADTLLPPVESGILLEAYKKNLTDWRASLKEDYSAKIQSLTVRLAILAAAVVIVVVLFGLWHRAIVRYVADLHRRYQLLLLRKIALWCVLGFVIAVALLNELGSLVTFAGLLSAGIAVALQSVFLAIVGYFLLMGKLGVKVGDRVEVSGVLGEVVDIGLMRLHVMELAGDEPNAQPTGRSIAFSNSVVFQATAGLFKQVPGAELLWREITVTFPPDSDFSMVESRITQAARQAYESYRQELEAMRSQMELNLSSVSVVPLEPTVRFALTGVGIEARLRFPVPQRRATEIDDRINRELIQSIRSEPPLKIVAASIPPTRIER